MIRKFLKRKSEDHKRIKFAYMNLTKQQIEGTQLNIIAKDYALYPLVYYIAGGNNTLGNVESADYEDLIDSFDQVVPN